MLTALAIVLVLGVFGLVLVVSHESKDMAEVKNEHGTCTEADYDLSDKLAAHKN